MVDGEWLMANAEFAGGIPSAPALSARPDFVSTESEFTAIQCKSA
jgi:hypothetical protein